jgi:iron(III) transport system permease protein
MHLAHAAPIRAPNVDADRIFRAICFLIPLIALSLFFIFPLLIIAGKSLVAPDGSWGLANYVTVLSSQRFWRIMSNSIVMGLATTLLSVVLGLIVAFAFHRCHMPPLLKILLQVFIALPLLAPSLVQSLGLIFLLGRNGIVSKLLGTEIEIYGFVGLLIANTLYALPQAVLIIGVALKTADARIYEAADVLGSGRWRQFIRITLPGIKFPLLSTGFVVFAITITDFGNAATIGGNYSVLATEIYNQVAGQMNFHLGAVVGMVLLLPSVAAFYMEKIASRRHGSVVSEAAVPLVPSRLPSRDVPMAVLTTLIALLPLLIVMIVVLVSFTRLWPYNFEFTLKHYSVSIDGGYRPLWTSIKISLICGLLGVFLHFILSVSLLELSGKLAKMVYFLCLLPAAVPGLVLGLAYLLAFNAPWMPLNFLYGTAVLFALCNLVHYWSQSFIAMSTGMRQFPQALHETARCLGASFVHRITKIIGPFALPTLLAVFLFLFMRSMVTLSGIIFLITPSLNVASVSIMRLEEAGNTGQAAAYASVTMLIVMGSSVLMWALLHSIKSRRAKYSRSA